MVNFPCLATTDPQLREYQRVPYQPPELLRELHVFDFFELMGNQALAGRALQLHQSSVSRIITGLSQQFDLNPNRESDNEPNPLRYLRLAYRAHRMGDGVMRLASDPLLQPLLAGHSTLQPVPPRFRPIMEWIGLIQQGVIDGALVMARAPEMGAPDERSAWQGVRWIDLGSMELQLAIADRDQRVVLVPDADQAPYLHDQLLERGWALHLLGPRRRNQQDWQQIAASHGLALPVAASLLPRQGLLQTHRSLESLTPPLLAPLWLLMAEEAAVNSTVQRESCRLRRRVQQGDHFLRH